MQGKQNKAIHNIFNLFKKMKLLQEPLKSFSDDESDEIVITQFTEISKTTSGRDQAM